MGLVRPRSSQEEAERAGILLARFGLTWSCASNALESTGRGSDRAGLGGNASAPMGKLRHGGAGNRDGPKLPRLSNGVTSTLPAL